ncbi:ATP-binding cassette domain-containing protein [Clostridiaceae bacterium DONG20-135]|uniref:ATP-binding cassette domain-containing protein n=1 Tax=Copranaerobaculum intestinale TaxID=2692629 RepID=A0A6N8U679_9FIRM|nr:ABC transporter ATP-binding protein [Copranaerobaculum intestinale]MXQ73015.1 ATP-binding cassette domain-containing protein [Copranaerobaculum intestinale]
MENILELRNVTKEYKNFTLDHVSFALPQGMIMGFVGENGAGKTTTIKTILDVVKKTSGEIYLFGQPIEQDSLQMHEDIAVVYDDCSISSFFKIKDVERMFKSFYKNWDTAKFNTLTERFELPGDKKISAFSRGMKMKLQLAIALAHNPKLLLLDEPTSGLDPIIRDEVLDMFLEFIQDETHSILFSSHITSDIEKIADYVTFIHKGKIIFCENKDDLLSHTGLLKIKPAVFEQLDHDSCIRYRKTLDHYEVLIKDRYAFQKKMPDAVIDRVTLDDIMLMYVKGETL